MFTNCKSAQNISSLAYPPSLTINCDPRRISLMSVIPSSPPSRALWSSYLRNIRYQFRRLFSGVCLSVTEHSLSCFQLDIAEKSVFLFKDIHNMFNVPCKV